MRLSRTALALGFVCAAALPLFGQSIQISDETVFSGDPVTLTATGTLVEPILGFSFGLEHDGAVLTAQSATQGSDVAATNSGAGADYFQVELAPAGGTGLFIACVFTVGGVLDSLGVGTHELALVNYNTSAGAAAGSTTSVDLSDALGSPPANIVFTTLSGVSTFPSANNGSVTFDVPPPTGTTCTLTDPCACDHDISWTNGATYTAVEVRVNGVLTQTLGGGATSTTVNTGAPGSSATIAVRGVIGALSSTDDSCTATCPAITPAPIPSGFTCTVTSEDAMTGCTVDVSWTLEGTYTGLELTVDGVTVSVLGGTATGDTITLPVSAASQQICLEGTDECGDPIVMNVCCDVTCNPMTGVQFSRGDCNDDGMFDIGDPVFLLGVLFSMGGPPNCDDACDFNDDGGQDISDAVYGLGALFNGTASPPAPFPGCGVDPTDTDGLDCAFSNAC